MALTQITGGDGIKDGSIKEADLNIDNTPTNDYVLTAKSSAAGGLTWAEGVWCSRWWVGQNFGKMEQQ